MAVREDKMNQTLGILGAFSFFIEFLSLFSRFLSLNSILEQKIYDQVVYFDRDILKEEGVIHLKVKIGIIPFPRSIPFNMPSNSKISKFQDDERVPEIVSKIKYVKNVKKENKDKDIQHGFLDFSMIRRFNPKTQIQNFWIRYEINLNININEKDIEEVKVEKKGEKIIVENKSNKRIIGYKVKDKMQLPFSLRDILNFNERQLETFKEECMKRNIKVYDDRGTLIEASLERLYPKNGIRMEGDISWFTDINPNERKTFKIFSAHVP